MKKAPLFLAAALLVGSLLLVPLAPAYATTDLIPGQAAVGQLSDNQTAPTAAAATPAPTTATTDTAPTTVVADTPTPAPATIIDTTAAPTTDAVTPAPTTATTDTAPTAVVADTPTPAPATIIDTTAAPTADAVTPAPTTATTDTIQATVVADIPTPAPATTMDITAAPTTAAATPEPTTATTTTATLDALPGQAAAGQLSDNQTIPSTAATKPPAPPPPPPAPATVIAAPALSVTAAPEAGSATDLSAAPALAVTTPISPTVSQTVSGTPPSRHHFPQSWDNGTAHLPPFPAPSDNGTVHFPHFPPSWDNSTVHFPHFPTSWDNGTAHFPPFPAPSDNGTAHLPPFPQYGHHPPYTPNPLPPQTNPTYPPYPYNAEYTLPIDGPVIGSLTASPNYIQSGQAATLSWDVSGASVVTISPTVGSVTNTGSLAVMPTYTTTYTLYAYNSQGAVNASTIVTVTPYASTYGGTYGTAVISSFTASPNYIQPGQPATLSWIVNNADTVTISPVVGPVANTGSFDVTPTYTTTYALSAYNGAGTISASTTVTVAPDVSSYVTPAYAIGTGVNIDTDSSGTASGSTVNASQFTNSIGNILNANGTSNSSTTAVNLWPMYLLLIGLAAVASVVITALLVRKPVVAHTQSTGMKTGYATSSTAIITATQPATLTPMTTIVEIGLPAKFVSSGGITMPVAGRPLGRRDFRALISPDKADTISRQHILVTYENGVYYIEDPGSTNGTTLNGSEIKGSGKHTIENGDTVELAHALNLTFKV